MNIEEAKQQLINYCISPETITDEDRFIQDELCKFIYEETKDVQYLVMTAGALENKNPQLVEKIYHLAIDNGDEHSCYYLANLYYSGKLGRPNYEKAFLYYTRASMTEEKGDGSFENPMTSVHNDSKLKLANMYKTGLYVDQDFEKYESLVNEVYEEVKDKEWYEERYFGLIAKGRLELEKENYEEGLTLLFESRIDLASCFDSAQVLDIIEDLKEVNDLIYEYIELDPTELDALDITEVLKCPANLRFRYKRRKHYLRTFEHDDKIVIEFEDQHFTDMFDFIMNARMGDEFFRAALFKTDDWEVI